MKKLSLLLFITLLLSACGDEAPPEEHSAPLTGNKAPILDKRDSFRIYPPAPQHWVNDFDDLFTPEEEKKLNNMISAFEKQTSMEIMVLTMDTAYVASDSFHSLVYQLSSKWEVGKKDKKNGITVAICKNYGLFRIATGKGTEQVLSNEEAEQIMNDVFFPLLRENQFYDAFHKGIKKIITVLKPRAAKIKLE